MCNMVLIFCITLNQQTVTVGIYNTVYELLYAAHILECIHTSILYIIVIRVIIIICVYTQYELYCLSICNLCAS